MVITRKELAGQYTDLIKLAKEEIIVIAGEFHTLGFPKVKDSLIGQLKQRVPVKIYVYDPVPEHEKIDELISYGAKVYLEQEYPKDHYLVVDDKYFSYHSHRRYNDTLLKDEEVTEEVRNDFYKQLNYAERNASPTCDVLDSVNDIRLQRELNKKTKKNEELNNRVKTLEIGIEEVRGLLRDDDISSKRLNSIYNLEMALGGVILASTIIFHNALGLIVVPMIIFAVGIFFVSFMSKRKINTMRSEYREKNGI